MNTTQVKPNLGRGPRKGKRVTKVELAGLRRKREDLGITLQMVADEASKTGRFGTMNPATVSGALYKGNSRNVLAALRRLIAEVEAKDGAVA